MDPPRANRPNKRGTRLEDDRSASHPQIGAATSSAAPYTAKKMEIHVCIESGLIPDREVRAKGKTGTIIP